jgi:uncharacterized protein (DUF1499 family)
MRLAFSVSPQLSKISSAFNYDVSPLYFVRCYVCFVHLLSSRVATNMRYLLLVAVIFLTGCASTFQVPEDGTDFTLDSCTPLLNCVSSTSSIFLYQVDPIQLTHTLDEVSWGEIKSVAVNLEGASVNNSRLGYLDMTCFSKVFSFPDYLEILVSGDGKSLDVRSQSLIGLFDFGVNRRRIERLTLELVVLGLAKVVEE